MIDLSQWRASVGLWSCCQAVSCSTRPATGQHNQSENLKCSHTKLPLLFRVLLLLMISRMISSILHSCTGITKHWDLYFIQYNNYFYLDNAFSCCSSKARSVMLNIFQLSLKVSDILACFLYSVFVAKLLLLSGDVELNPGPVAGKRTSL